MAEDEADFLDRVVAAESGLNMIPSPRPSSKGGLMPPSGSLDGFFLVKMTV